MECLWGEPDQLLSGDEPAQTLRHSVCGTDGVAQGIDDLAVAADSQPEGLNVPSLRRSLAEEDGDAGLHLQESQLGLHALCLQRGLALVRTHCFGPPDVFVGCLRRNSSPGVRQPHTRMKSPTQPTAPKPQSRHTRPESRPLARSANGVTVGDF